MGVAVNRFTGRGREGIFADRGEGTQKLKEGGKRMHSLTGRGEMDFGERGCLARKRDCRGEPLLIKFSKEERPEKEGELLS